MLRLCLFFWNKIEEQLRKNGSVNRQVQQARINKSGLAQADMGSKVKLREKSGEERDHSQWLRRISSSA